MFLLGDYWNMINDQILMTTIQICENFILQMTSFGCCYGFKKKKKLITKKESDIFDKDDDFIEVAVHKFTIKQHIKI